MPSGILDIINKTEQMSFLNKNPEVTFFRTIFRRHTSFSTEFVVEPAAGSDGVSDYVATLSKAGDLVHRMFVRVKLKARERVPHEPTSTSWAFEPQVLDLFQNYLPISSASSILTTYQSLIQSLKINDILIGNISDIETFVEVDNVGELLSWYGNATCYRAYQFLDFVDIMSDLQTAYANGGSITRDAMEQYKNHPIHEIAFLDGANTRLLPEKNPVLMEDFSPYLFDSYYVEIGGNIISQYSPQFYSCISSFQEQFSTPEYSNISTATESSQGNVYVHIPLLFWFCKTTGVSLPLCAIRYQEVRVGVTATTLPFIQKAWTVENVDVVVEYIHLSDMERLKFMTSNHEYLIQQVQEHNIKVPRNSTDITQELTFTRPSIELLWFPSVFTNSDGRFDFLFKNIIRSCEITLGGDSIGTEKDARYYRLIPSFQSHNRVDSQKEVYGFSFAIDADEYQPSGSLNLGRIPHTFLRLTLDEKLWESSPQHVVIYIFNRCYNVLRIANGFTDVAFS